MKPMPDRLVHVNRTPARRGWLEPCLIAVALASAGCSKPSATTAIQPIQPDDLSLPLADFTLTERDGRTVKKADLKGKVWVASFVFTRCSGPCPQVTASVARLQSELAGEADVRFVTFTVDPARDDPNELRKYAEIYRADKDRWLFLTGREEDIRHLLIDSFKVHVTRNDKPKKAGEEYDHSTRLVVVDKEGSIRGYYQGMADPNRECSADMLENDLKKLKDKVRALLDK